MTMPKAATGFFILTDTEITMKGLKDTAGEYVNDATVTATLHPRGGGAALDNSAIAFSYISGSNGDYRAVLPSNVPLQACREYDMNVVCLHGGRQLTLLVRRRADYAEI
jgi:hypothetical protein